MKRCLSLVLCLMLLLATAALAETTWTCPNCGYKASGNFCSNCGCAAPVSNSGSLRSGMQVYAGATVTFGSYEQDADYSNGTEPIEWTVLNVSGSRALLVSKYVLKWDYFDSMSSEASWNQSSICYWLNGSFLNSAFTGTELQAIQVNTGANAQKVFLLSEGEVRQYMGTVYSRIGYPTAACAREGAYTWPATSACDWWLRDTKQVSAFDYNKWTIVAYRYAECITGSGDYDLEGQMENVNRRGVRPAIWVDTSML